VATKQGLWCSIASKTTRTYGGTLELEDQKNEEARVGLKLDVWCCDVAGLFEVSS